MGTALLAETVEISWQAWLTLGSVVALVAALASGRIGPDTAMLSVLVLLLAAGVLTPAEAFAGFSNTSVLMIAALFVVASGLTETGAMELMAGRLLGRPKSVAAAQLRLCAPVAGMSAFMNNTPIVAMYMPLVTGYARRLGASPSKLFMPLAFASILGGACTLIGTSTNVAVNGLYLTYFDAHEAELAARGLSRPGAAQQFWQIAVVGVPATVLGLAFIVLTSRWLLPDRVTAETVQKGARAYTTSVIVEPEGPLVGKTIEDAGLRHLPGLFVFAIERASGERVPAVGPEERLEAGDRLLLSGVVDSVVELLKTRGLSPDTDQVAKVQATLSERTVVEAVVSDTSPLVRRSVRESNFRGRFNAAIIAIHRGGQRVEGRIGDIVFQPGDTLLLSTHRDFPAAHRNSSHFYLVSNVEGSTPPRRSRAWLAALILAALVVTLTAPTGVAPVVAVWVAAVAMVLTRCTTGTAARSSMPWQVLVVIAAAIGVGRAMDKTGAAEAVATVVFGWTDSLGPRGLLFVFSLATMVACQFVTNKAAAVLMFPVAMALARDSGLSPEPFVVALMASAACSFLTPIGFVVNLMVYGPGGYRFSDYLRLGGPLTLLVATLCATLVPAVFPLTLAGAGAE